jgi:DNA-binding transcriptional LysR family regulator
MQPTPFALELLEQARPILRSIQRALSPRQVFDPATSRRLFRFAAPDFARALFTSLLARVRSQAPGASLEWSGARDPMLLEIAEGQLDVAVAPAGLRLPAGIATEAIGALTWGCFARRGHPAFRKWGRNAWSHWPHVAVRVGDSLASPVNAAAKAGLERTIAGWVPHFSGIAPVLAESDLIATLPAVAMTDTLRPYGLDSRPVPFPIDPLPHAMLWSAQRGRDPEIGWLRDQLRPIVQSKFASTSSTSAPSSRR